MQQTQRTSPTLARLAVQRHVRREYCNTEAAHRGVCQLNLATRLDARRLSRVDRRYAAQRLDRHPLAAAHSRTTSRARDDLRQAAARSLHSGLPLTVNNTALVAATGGQVGVSGSFATHLREERSESPQTYDFVFSLLEESWDATVGQDGARPARCSSLVSIRSKMRPGGWNAVVQPQLRATHITRRDDQTAALTLPAFADYEISQPRDPAILLRARDGGISTQCSWQMSA